MTQRLKLYHDPNNPLFFYDDEEGKPISYIYGYKNLFALIEQDRWVFVDDISEADVIPIHFTGLGDEYTDTFRYFKEYIRPDQVAIFMSLYNADNHMTANFYRGDAFNPVRACADKVLIVHTNGCDTSDPNYIFHDILWNREKYYMCGDLPEDFDISGQRWTPFMDRNAYTYSPVDKQYSPDNKKILCLNRLYRFGEHFQTQMRARSKLKETLWSRPDIYISDPTAGVFFETNGWEGRDAKLNSGLDVTKSSGTWYPVADKYYNTSYVSVFIESVTQPAYYSTENTEDLIFYATEKTFDPLLKGNFILPFSTPRYVEKLQEYYGFKLPNWIDYSYDKIYDMDERLEAYIASVEKIYSLSLEELHEHYLQDKEDILNHNQKIFESRSYDSLHDKVLASINKLNWK